MPRIRFVTPSKSINTTLEGSDRTKKSKAELISNSKSIEGDKRRRKSVLPKMDARDVRTLNSSKVRQKLSKNLNNPFCKSKLALDAAKMKISVKEKQVDEYSFQAPPNANSGIVEENREYKTKHKRGPPSEVGKYGRRSTKKQRRINLEVLEIIRRTKESILSIRAQANNNDQKTQNFSYTGNTLPVTVSVVRGNTVTVSQHIIRQTGSVQEEDIGLLPSKSRMCLNSIG